jgi:DNA-binding LacI/PurR family transcriptional regulator
VLVNAAVDHLRFPRVSCDDAEATEQAGGHLAALGHERIGMVLCPPDHMPSRRKLEAYLGLSRAGMPTGPELVEHTTFSLEGGHAAAGRLLDKGVTGIVCASDVLAMGAIRAARRRGLSVPADISVIGYDDSALMTCMDPPLTTVRQPIEAMGRAAVDMLVAQIDKARVPNDELLFEPELVVRASTAPASSVDRIATLGAVGG